MSRPSLRLTPHGHLVLEQSEIAPEIGERIAERLSGAFARGVGYGLLVTGVAQIPGLQDKANGSLVQRGGRNVGSSLIGQGFEGTGYFHPRPSAAGDGYDAMSSSASTLGPTNPALVEAVEERRSAYEQANGNRAPVDAVTASGSGLDPHISPENARLQARRVAL